MVPIRSGVHQIEQHITVLIIIIVPARTTLLIIRDWVKIGVRHTPPHPVARKATVNRTTAPSRAKEAATATTRGTPAANASADASAVESLESTRSVRCAIFEL